jgi:predicted acetyltransferase
VDIDVRTITDAEVPAWCAAVNTGFLNPAGGVDAEVRRPALVLDRTWGGFDGDRVVSTLRSFPTELTLPGGRRVAASAVTAVTTTATHRRRGLATRMVTGEMAVAVERGEPASILIAAEWRIYGRYGYGATTEHQTWTLNAAAAQLRHRPRGTVEHIDRDTARALAPEIFERHRLSRVGEIARTERRWDLDFDIIRFESWPAPKQWFHVLARDLVGTPVGYARYRNEEAYAYRQPRGRVEVESMIAASPLGEALLWDHLTNLDMVATVKAIDRPADELLPWLLVDARHAEPSERADFLWLRPLDVRALLSARSYAATGRVVVEVVDSLGFAAGRFALDAGPDGATCVVTDRSADLTVDASTLGSVYLGGYRLRALAAAGLVDEHRAGAVATADALFATATAPWCSTWF